MRRLLRAAVLGSLVLLAWAVPAQASQMLTWSARNVTLKVNHYNLAVVSWIDPTGGAHHLLAWGAINALAPSQEVPQVRFHLDYSGGWGSFGTGYWKKVRNTCGPYDGPPLAQHLRPVRRTAARAPAAGLHAARRQQLGTADLAPRAARRRLGGRLPPAGARASPLALVGAAARPVR
jgi:hypothetical protein